jgi:multicomponent Na+:H+ antiporter subunit D
MTELLHPTALLLFAAPVAALCPRRARAALAVAAPLLALAIVWALPAGTERLGTLFGQPLVWLRVDALSRPFALVFASIATLAALYGWAGSRRFHVAGLVGAAAAIGVVLAGDWMTFYACWELLALASFVLILDGRHAGAHAAAYRYLLFHALGGVLLLTAIALAPDASGVGPLPGGAASGFLLAAFLVNAALPPLHAWLVDAYPESSPAGSVVLSALVTKSAVYALARAFPGEEVLVGFGVGMALYGVTLAVIENDLRRLLAYHIVSQVGYMVVGVGLGTPLALAGTVAHAFSHILYKGLLFMAAGAVLSATGRRSLAGLGGLRHSLPSVFVLYMVGALAISGAPLLNGFVSKSLIVAAAEQEQRWIVAGLLSLASVGTFLSVGLKLPGLVFGGAPRATAVRPVPRAMLAAMTLAALLCALFGSAPALLYGLIPFPGGYEPYTPGHVIGALQLMAGAAIGFALLRGELGARRAVTRDADVIYRWIGRAVGVGLAAPVARAMAALEGAAASLIERLLAAPRRQRPQPLAYAMVAVLLAFSALAVLLSLR